LRHRFRSALWALDGLRHDGWTSLAVATVVAFALSVLTIGPSPINGPWDVFILIDGGARVAEGQVPGVDFSNPIGPLTYVLTALPMKLDHAVGIDAFAQGDVLFLLAVSLSALFVARRRLPGALTLAFTVFVAGLTPISWEVALGAAILDHAVKNIVTLVGGVGSMFSPPRSTIVSFLRPMILISPLCVSIARSPVSSHPSLEMTLAVRSGRL